MKNLSKSVRKVISLVMVSVLLATTLLAVLPTGAEEVENYLVLDEVGGLKDATEEGSIVEESWVKRTGANAWDVTLATALTKKPLDTMGFKMTSANPIRMEWANFGTNHQHEIAIHQAKGDYKGVMFYVDLPKTGATNGIWAQVYDEGTPAWSGLIEGKPFYTLNKGDAAWTESAVSCATGWYQKIDLVDDFEGYVYIPFDSFWGFTTLDWLQMIVKDFGGADGDAYIGAFYFVKGDTLTTDAYINGEADPRDLMTGQIKGVEVAAVNLDEVGEMKNATVGSIVEESWVKRTGAKAWDITLAVSQTRAPLNTMGFKMSSANPIRMEWANFASNHQHEVAIHQTKGDYKGVMFFVDLPKTGATNGIWAQVYDEGTPAWSGLIEGAPVYTLNKGDAAWTESAVSCATGWYQKIDLVDDFEGYVYIPFDSFWGFTTLDWLQLIVKDMGGANGDAYLGAFYFVKGDTLATNAYINGEAELYDLNSGSIYDGEPDTPDEPVCEHVYDNACDADCNLCGEPRAVADHVYDNKYDADCNVCGAVREVPEKPADPVAPNEIPNVPAAETIDTLYGLSAGDEFPLKKAGAQAGIVSGTTVESVAGLGGIGVELDASEVIEQDWETTFTTNYQIEMTVDVSRDDYHGFLIYVKLPQTGKENAVWMQVYDDKTPLWCQFSGSSIYALAKGEQQWNGIAMSLFGTFIGAKLPDGFEGYLYIPFDAFYGQFVHVMDLQFNFMNFGNGNKITLIPYLVKNDVRNKNYGWFNGEVDENKDAVVRNIFTGEIAEGLFVPNDAIAPEPGTILRELPEGTVDEGFIYTATTNSATLSWGAVEGATSYRVDLYATALNDGNLEYGYIKSVTTTETTAILTDLEKTASYFAIVYVINGDKCVAILPPDAIELADEDASIIPGDGNDPIDPDDGNDPVDPDDGADVPDTGDVTPYATVIILAAVACAGVLLTKSRRLCK